MPATDSPRANPGHAGQEHTAAPGAAAKPSLRHRPRVVARVVEPLLRAAEPAMRPLAERATHRLVLRRRLPAPYQGTRIYASSEAGLKYLRRRLTHVDPVLVDLVRETVRPGAVVWDIGANVGLFSFAAATAAGPSGHVLAVEPDNWLVGLLRRSAELPGTRAQVEVLAAAVGDATGVSRFCIASRNRATNHLAGFGHRADVRAVMPVPTLTLDGLLACAPTPDVLKIDVEGAERLVLEGGRRLLAAARPTLICEVAAANADAVSALLVEQGYRVLDGEVPAVRRVPLAAAPWTTLALPVGPRAEVMAPRQAAAEPAATGEDLASRR
jgi:FkbM family methyltransferase